MPKERQKKFRKKRSKSVRPNFEGCFEESDSDVGNVKIATEPVKVKRRHKKRNKPLPANLKGMSSSHPDEECVEVITAALSKTVSLLSSDSENEVPEKKKLEESRTLYAKFFSKLLKSDLHSTPLSKSNVQKKKKIQLKVPQSKIEKLHKKQLKAWRFNSIFQPGKNKDPDKMFRKFLNKRTPEIRNLYDNRMKYFKFTPNASPETRAAELFESIKPPRGLDGERMYEESELLAGSANLSDELTPDSEAESDEKESESSNDSGNYLCYTEDSDDGDEYYFFDTIKYMVPGYDHEMK